MGGRSQSHDDGIAYGERIAFPLRRLWQAAAGPGGWGTMRLVKWQDRLFVGDRANGDHGATLSCIYAATGHVLWRHTNDLPGRSAVGAVTSDAILFYRASWDGPAAAYGHADGRRLWTNEYLKPAADKAVVLQHTIILDSGPGESQSIVSLDQRDGAVVWSKQYGGSTYVECTGDDAIVLVRQEAGDFRSVVVLISGTNGEILWARDLRETYRSWDVVDKVWRPGYVNNVTTDGERLYLGLRGGALLTLDAASGEPPWLDEGEGGTTASAQTAVSTSCGRPHSIVSMPRRALPCGLTTFPLTSRPCTRWDSSPTESSSMALAEP